MAEIKLDPEFEKYGYKCPSKIRPGCLSLRQFDEFVNQYKQNKSIEFINQFAAEHKVDVTNLHILLEFYKPFVRLNTQEANSSKTESKQTPKQIESDSVNQIFPNLK